MVSPESFVLTTFMTIPPLMNLRGFTSYWGTETNKTSKLQRNELKTIQSNFRLAAGTVEWLICFVCFICLTTKQYRQLLPLCLCASGVSRVWNAFISSCSKQKHF